MQTAVITWRNIHEYGDLWLQHHQLRYREFITRQHWHVPHHEDLEWDAYDTPRAFYVLVVDDGKVVATTRLISTEQPYMLADLWPELLNNQLPHDPYIWEASRFAVDHRLPAPKRQAALRSLILAVQLFGSQRNIKNYLGVMPIWIYERVLRRNHCLVDVIGDGVEINGVRTAAAKIWVNQATVDKLSGRVGAIAA